MKMMNKGYERLTGSTRQPKAWTIILIVSSFLIIAIVCLYLSLTNKSSIKVSANKPKPSPIVRLPFGQIEGLQTTQDGQSVSAFLGIPFAVPPVGSLRFRKPLPWTQSWKGVRSAKKQPKSCLQPPRIHTSKVYQDNSEDCLYLNLWTPVNLTRVDTELSEGLPVFVFCFGGAFQFGSITIKKHDGQILSRALNAVIVEMNSRVGPLGFFTSGTDEAPPNVGLYDQALALEWIKEHIHLFGGNPNSITLSGISSGSMSVALHTLSPVSNHLFHRGLLMSGAVLTYPQVFSLDTSLKQSNILSEAVGCGSNNGGPLSTQTMNCLRKVNGRLLLQNESVNIIPKDNNHYGNLIFFPTYGDDFLPDEPLRLLQQGQYMKNASFVFGNVIHEGATLVKYDTKLGGPRKSEDPSKYYRRELVKFLDDIGGNFSLASEDAQDIYFKDVDRKDAFTMYIDAMGDVQFTCPMKIFAEALSRDNRVYEYVMTYPATDSSYPSLAPAHGDDCNLLFGNFVGSDSDRIVSRKFQKEVKSFINNGTVSWRPYFRTSSGFLVNTYYDLSLKDDKLSNLNEYRSLTCSFWKHKVWPIALEFGSRDKNLQSSLNFSGNYFDI